jgi:hypothetical protein
MGVASTARAELGALMARLTPVALEAAGREQFLRVFDQLLALAYREPQNLARRSQLCEDGTPVEMSVAIDNRGRVGTRAVCDVAGGLPDVHEARVPAQLRALAGALAPDFPGSGAMLDEMFARHLAERRPSSRFQVWYGAGVAPGKPLLIKLYFNAEWLDADGLRDALAPHLPPAIVERCLRLPAAAGSRYKCVAYDVGADGPGKIKLYLEPTAGAPADIRAMLDRCAEAGGERLDDLLTLCLGDLPRRWGQFALVLGLIVGRERPDVAFEPKIYVHLKSWGAPDFAAVRPVMARLLRRWGFEPRGFGLGPGPRGLEPTLLGIGRSGAREGMALYFKPVTPW